MEQANGQETIYVINEQVRQVLITIISRAIHPSVAFDQVEAIKRHLDDMRPVEVTQVPPRPTYTGPDDDGCGDPAERRNGPT